MYDIFGFLATPLGFAMRLLYDLILNYGWTIIIFTILVRVIMFPLSIAQQKSTARMSAYQPMIQEIQKKWSNDKNRQNAEMQKFYEENNLKMTAGCLPTLVNMLVLFGIIAVIQAPLNYMVGMTPAQIETGYAIVKQYNPETEIGKKLQTSQALLIGEIRDNPELFRDKEITFTNSQGEKVTNTMDSEIVDKVVNFRFEFMGLNLAAVPTMNMNQYLILPILSILTMFASQFIIMKFSGTAAMQGKNTMLIMTLMMGAMFGFYAFTVPTGFSLYYTISNIVMTLQQLIVKRIYDPEKIKKQVQEEIEQRKKEKKAKKEIVIKDEKGVEIKKEVSEAEMSRIRLEMAKKLDEEKYGDLQKEIEENKAKLNGEKIEESPKAPAEEDVKVEEENIEEDLVEDIVEIKENNDIEKEEKAYKPGRRKRAKQSKENTVENRTDNNK